MTNVSDPRKEILVAFSLYTNGRKMLDSKPSADTLTCLHGIRFLSICWVVLGHRYMLSMDVPSINQLTGYSVSSFTQRHVKIRNV
jgi:hypothetical protein